MEPKNPERFERAVDLPLYLGYRGFQLASDDRDPSRLTMLNPKTGEALIVAKDLESGTWSYNNARDSGDRGTLTDFLVTHDGLSPPACLERIVALGNPLVRDAEGHRFRQFVQERAPDLQRAVARHLTAVEAETSAHRALSKLGIGRGTLDEGRFGRIKTDDDLAKMLRDPADLWASKYRATDHKIVLTEQPIDAMAYEKSRGKQRCCYMATGGTPSEAQLKKLAHVLCDMPPGTKVVLAFGRDEVGKKLAADLQSLLPAIKMERDMPAFGARWSDQMKLEQRHVRSMSRGAPSLGG
jgi:hypothetical protein